MSYKAPLSSVVCLNHAIVQSKGKIRRMTGSLSTMLPFNHNPIDAWLYIFHRQRQQRLGLIILASLGNWTLSLNCAGQGKCLAFRKEIRETTKILQECLYQSRSTLKSPTLADLLEDSRLTLHFIIHIWTQICQKKTSPWYRRRCSQEGNSTGDFHDQQ